MKKFTFWAVLLCSSLGGHSAMAACYVVYDAAQQVVYRSEQPPVDLSLPLHQAVLKVVPGGTLVFSPGRVGCEFEVDELVRHASQEPPVRAVPPLPSPRGLRG